MIPRWITEVMAEERARTTGVVPTIPMDGEPLPAIELVSPGWGGENDVSDSYDSKNEQK